MIQRNKESAALLTKLAQPKIFVAPEKGRLQASIVDKVERAIKAEVQHVKDKQAELGEARRKEWPPAPRDYFELFLGGIELTTIPDTDRELLQEAKLVDLPGDNALDPKVQAYDLAVQSGAADELVQNTLKTMIEAKQIEYLRLSGLPNDDWKIIVEVHYIRTRTKNRPQFHKDTLGQTLFVNLNYVTDEPMAGAEFMVNPTRIPDWDAVISQNLPTEFYEDLRETRRRLPELTTIEASDIPAQGVLAFVDEAIHHRTPVLGHRTVRGSAFATYLKQRHGEAKYSEGEALYAKYQESSWPLVSYWPESRRWIRWIEMAGQPNEKYTRVDFDESGMARTEIDELIASVDRESRTVSIPRVPGEKIRDIHPDERKRPPLKRQMSERALKNTLPPDVPGDRRFFRNWVRAVEA